MLIKDEIQVARAKKAEFEKRIQDVTGFINSPQYNALPQHAKEAVLAGLNAYKNDVARLEAVINEAENLTIEMVEVA